MELVTISQEAKNLLAQLDDKYIKVSEMADSEREFLTELILRYQPKKVLEVGVAAGSSSVIILNAIKDNEHAQFYSVDYRTNYYREPNKLTGFIVDEYPDLAKRRKFYSGGFVSKFLDSIGGDIDFCLIDTVHSLPGEILDFLMVLPYLKSNAVVVFHDTNLHTFHRAEFISNNILISAITGKKIVLKDHEERFYHYLENKFYPLPFSNIAGVILNKEKQFEEVWDIFNVLTLKWNYLPTPEDLCEFRRHIKQHYDIFYCQFFEEILAYQKIKYFSARGTAAPVKAAAQVKKAPVPAVKTNDIKKVVSGGDKAKERAIKLAIKRIRDPYQYYADARFAPVRFIRYFYKKEKANENLKRKERAIKLAIKRIQNPYQYYADAKFAPLRLLRFMYKKR